MFLIRKTPLGLSGLDKNIRIKAVLNGNSIIRSFLKFDEPRLWFVSDKLNRNPTLFSIYVRM